METIVGYHRPESVEEALALLNRGNLRSVVLAGGTWINTVEFPQPVEIIDLQGIGLGEIRTDETFVEIGAMVRLAQVARDTAIPQILQELARREGPNTVRNMATVGGAIAAAHPESEFVAGCLVYQGRVILSRPGGVTETVGLVDLLDDHSMLDGSIITTLRIETDGLGVAERTGRTPSDSSIVTAVARRAPDGRIDLALTGVASTPILVPVSDTRGLDPPGDFRGSREYRRHLAGTLSARVIEQLGVRP